MEGISARSRSPMKGSPSGSSSPYNGSSPSQGSPSKGDFNQEVSIVLIVSGRIH